MLSILLADDHQPMRQVISEILRHAGDVRLVAEASSFREVIDLSFEFQPDVVLMDVHMPDEQKVESSDLKSCLINRQLLAMSLWTDPETKALAESFGAITLLDKANLVTELLPSLGRCAQMRGAKASPS